MISVVEQNTKLKTFASGLLEPLETGEISRTQGCPSFNLDGKTVSSSIFDDDIDLDFVLIP